MWCFKLHFATPRGVGGINPKVFFGEPCSSVESKEEGDNGVGVESLEGSDGSGQVPPLILCFR